MGPKNINKDIPIFLGILALIIFGHACFNYNPALARGLPQLLLQGNGGGYASEPVNERATDLEYNARRMLYQLGSAEAGYSEYYNKGTYAWIQNLVNDGYLQPNDSGATLVNSYSMTFYLSDGHLGFTIVAESNDFDLRSFLIDENQLVVPITPVVMEDPDESWTFIRELESTLYYDYGGYDYLNSLLLLNYDPPLGLRLNRERTGYLLFEFAEADEVLVPNDELHYISNLTSYMLGDTRPGY